MGDLLYCCIAPYMKKLCVLNKKLHKYLYNSTF